MSAFTVEVVLDRVEAEEARSALEWAQVRAMAADGLSQREITRRLGINRRTVAKLMQADEQPCYERPPSGSMLDPLEGVLRELLENWPDIKAPRATEILRDDYGYEGSVDLVRRRLARLQRRQVRPAQRTGYRPGQVLQLDWGEMPTRPKLAGREPRVYALVATLPYPGAQSALQLRFDRGELPGGTRTDLRLARRRGPRVRLRHLRSAVARRNGDQITWDQRFVTLRGQYAFHAHACTPETPREKGSVEGGGRHLKTGFWPARQFGCLAELDDQGARWRDEVCNRRIHATGCFPVAERLAHEREVLRPLPPTVFDFAGARPVRVGLDGYLKLGGNFHRAPVALVHQRVDLRFDRDQVWIRHAGADIASYATDGAPSRRPARPGPRSRPSSDTSQTDCPHGRIAASHCRNPLGHVFAGFVSVLARHSPISTALSPLARAGRPLQSPPTRLPGRCTISPHHVPIMLMTSANELLPFRRQDCP